MDIDRRDFEVTVHHRYTSPHFPAFEVDPSLCARYTARMVENPKRRWQFSLRTLLIVMTLAAFPCAWVGYALKWQEQRKSAGVKYSVWVWRGDGEYELAPGGLWLFGGKAVRYIFASPGRRPLMEQEVAELRQLFPEAHIVTDGIPIQLPAEFFRNPPDPVDPQHRLLDRP